jgi:anti-sigma regulatory factor (Ser/Thr protein kinase)
MIASDTDGGVVLLQQRFDVDDLVDVREQVHLTCVAAGLPGARAEGFSASINEAMTNAIVHGGQVREVTVSMADKGVRAEVVDDGRADPFAVPPRPPPPEDAGGRGLWIASQLCDRVLISTDEGGTSVVLETDFPRRFGQG